MWAVENGSSFYNQSMLLEGMFLPLTTPFFPDGRLNLRKLRQNVAHYSLTPAAGMVVLGANSESQMLSDLEAREVLESAMESAAETKVMIAGVSRESVRGTLEWIETAETIGYDAVLVQTPKAASLAEARLYFEAVADGSALPIVLSGEISYELLGELAAHPRVIGYVHGASSGLDVKTVLERTAAVKRTVTVTQVFAAVTRRMQRAQAEDGLVSAASLGGGAAVAVGTGRPAVKTRTKIVGFQVLAGGTEGMLEALQAGAVETVTPFAAAAPQGCYEVYAAWKDGDLGLAEEKQARLIEAVRLVEGSPGVAGVKYGCDLNGYAGGGPRLPGLGLTGEERLAVERVMDGLKS